MTPHCAQCQAAIPANDVNVAQDIAFCRGCNSAQKLSALVHGTALDSSILLERAPDGAWFRETSMGTLIGATHRSVAAAIVTLLIALFWNGITSVFVALALSATLNHLDFAQPSWFPAPIMNGASIGVGLTILLWLFLTPFMLIGLVLFGAFLSSCGGRSEVRLGEANGTIFSGIGALGRNRRFARDAVKDVRMENRQWRDSDGDRHSKTDIVIELLDGKKLKFGSTLTDERKKFVGAALRKVLLNR